MPSMELLTTCSRLALKSGYYSGLILVDSDSRKFLVVGARNLRSLKPRLNMLDILKFFSANPRERVELIFSDNPPILISVEELKGLLAHSFQEESISWEAMCDFEEFEQKVKGAASVQEIFSIFSEYNLS